MCNFLSAIVLKNGDVLHNPYTDSHEDLVQMFNLRDNRDGNFARVEFTPKETTDLDKPDKYLLKVDEGRTPDWLTVEMQEKTATHLRSVVSRMVIAGDATMLCGGAYILAPAAKVSTVKWARIVVMLGSANVGTMRGSANVGTMWDSANVGTMWDSANVGTMWDSAKVGTMCDSANVGTMRDSANVGTMRDSAQVGTMLNSAKVGTMRDSAKVGTMRDSAKVGEMWGSAQVGTMRDGANVGTMCDSANVGEMWDSAKVETDNRKK